MRGGDWDDWDVRCGRGAETKGLQCSGTAVTGAPSGPAAPEQAELTT